MLKLLKRISDGDFETWAFIRDVEHVNQTEQWKPFTRVRPGITITGEVSTFGNVRNCNTKVITRTHPRTGEERKYFHNSWVTLHRVVLETFKPNLNPSYYTCVDHIDRDPLNNRLSNLRWSTRQLNNLNTAWKSGKGVSTQNNKSGKSYRVRMSFQRRGQPRMRKIGLGTFKTMEEADARYLEALADAYEILEEF